MVQTRYAFALQLGFLRNPTSKGPLGETSAYRPAKVKLATSNEVALAPHSLGGNGERVHSTTLTFALAKVKLATFHFATL
jgi:hypothetical protein